MGTVGLGPGKAVVVRVVVTAADEGVVVVAGAPVAVRLTPIPVVLAVALGLPPGRAVCSRSICCSRAQTLAFSPVWSKPRSLQSLTISTLVARLRSVCCKRRKALECASVAIRLSRSEGDFRRRVLKSEDDSP